MGPESETISRDMLENLAVAVRSKLSAKGIRLFELMFMRGLPPEEVATIAGLSVESVYAWKSRLSRQVKEILAELTTVPPSVPPSSLYDYDSSPGLRDPALETLVRRRASPSRPSTPDAVRRGPEASGIRESDANDQTDPGRSPAIPPPRRGAAS
jgi:hypothetical protein